jgi:hypothetical protein
MVKFLKILFAILVPVWLALVGIIVLLNHLILSRATGYINLQWGRVNTWDPNDKLVHLYSKIEHTSVSVYFNLQPFIFIGAIIAFITALCLLIRGSEDGSHKRKAIVVFTFAIIFSILCVLNIVLQSMCQLNNCVG